MTEIFDQLAVVILAAGKGSRMNSNLPKVLHEVGGRPMVNWVVDTAHMIGADPVVVIVGHRHTLVESKLADEAVWFALQGEQKGTAHAVEQTRSQLENFDGDILVLSGDVPGLKAETLIKLIKAHRNSGAVASMLTADVEHPTGYGRIVKDENGLLVTVVEEKDATDDQRAIREINSGIYIFQAERLFDTLPLVKNKNNQQEYYLPDVLYLLREQNLPITVEKAENYHEILGVNTLDELREINEFIAT